MWLRFRLLPRKKNSDKTRYGHTLVLAGSRAYRGAALLASKSALLAGSGLVTLGIPEGLESYFSKNALAETMLLGLPETNDKTLGLQAFGPVKDFLKKRHVTSIALGPGLSQNPLTMRLVRLIVRSVQIPIVLDADGLNSFKGRKAMLRDHAGPLVLTPHRGEFERLFQEVLPEDKKKRLTLAKKISRQYGLVLVLKGHETLVVSRDHVHWNKTGNPGMAKGGSGDVLTGVLAAFIAQGLSTFEAAAFGVHFHGLAGDFAVKKKGELSVLATDLIDALPEAFNFFGQARIRPVE